MANKKILDNEILSDDELDNISGGYLSETIDIVSAIGEVYLVNGFHNNQPAQFYCYLPIEEVAPYLKEHYGIDAKINLGTYDPGAHDYISEGAANEYSFHGKTITHQQVMDIINIVNGK